MLQTITERTERAQKLIAILKKRYPKPKTELTYQTGVQLLVAVMLSAQCTDKKVNECTDILFTKYKTARDFSKVSVATLQKEIATIPFFRNKAKYIVKASTMLVTDFNGEIPRTIEELVQLSGVAYKTANVVLGEWHHIWDGIAVDTHVRRFALRFELTDQTDLTKISKDLEAIISRKDWKYVNNGFVLYGRYVCPARKHDCLEHPLTKIYPHANDIWPLAGGKGRTGTLK